MKARLTLFCILINCTLWAQQPLSESRRTSAYRYIYRITPQEALTLYQSKRDKVSEQYLHTLVDSFPAGNLPPSLPAGNYLFFHAVNNRQRYELVTEGDVQLKTINNRRDLAITLHTGNGRTIREAKVSAGRRQLVYEPATQTYRSNRFRKRGNISVLHLQTAYYFPIQRSAKRRTSFQHLPRRLTNTFPIKNITRTVQRWRGESAYSSYFHSPVQHEKKFRGFMTFSKPIYKPGDTVQLKAFVMTRRGKGLKEPLLLRLTDRSFDFDTIIAVIKPYRRGGYLHEFVLNDSLDLDLDERYLLTLEEERSRKYDLNEYIGNLDDDDYAAKRKVVMRGKFEYEEYELQSITFSARTDEKEHNRGVPLSIYGKATDENDLPVMDGRLQVTVTPNFNFPIQTFSPFTFIPDTLWSHTVDLETLGETRILLPDSIFPAASLHYNIECVLLNSSNERQTEQLAAQYMYGEQSIHYDLRGDSLHIDYRKRGVTLPKTAMLYAIQNQDTVLKHSINLPATLKINPYFSHYEVRTDSLNKSYHLKGTAGMVSVLASRTHDSLFISLSNPQRLPVWYTLWAGKRRAASGFTDSLAISTRTQTKRNYFLTLHYVYGNKIYSEDYTIPYQDKLLKLTMKGPQVVYPGQKATLEIDVRDARGNAVEGADVTAYGFTRKFTNARMPVIPYLGKIHPLRKTGVTFTKQDPKTWLYESRLNWERWSREMGLDTIEYYQFLRPDSFYLNQEAVAGGLTQVAPFVVIGGELQPIHLLYIDEKPYFFSQSQHLKQYSFPVHAGKHSFRIRTHNRTFTLKDVVIPNGVKTIISINGDTSNKRISIQGAPDTLTKEERLLLTKYTILINNTYGERLSYIEQDHQLFPLPKPQYRTHIPTALIGPLAPRKAQLVVHGKYHQGFDVEGGYLHEIRQGLVKQKQVNANTHISKWLPTAAPEPNFRDFVLTAAEIDSLWKAYLDHRSATEDLFYHPQLPKNGNGALRIQILQPANSTALFTKNLFLFRHDDTDFTRVYRGNATDLGYLAPGVYRLLFLLREDQYIIQDSIRIHSGGVNYYQINPGDIRPRDSISMRLAAIIHNRELANRQDGFDLNTIRESYNTGFVDPGTFTNTVYGQLRDKEGNPIPFAHVQVKGTRVGTLTDANGYYRIQTPGTGTLVFGAVGYDRTEQPIRNNQMDIVMLAATNRVEEVVVVGYAASRKSNFTGSIASVEGLQGRVPGIFIRGAQSVSGSSTPLIVIDGVPYEGTLESLDPSQYANITVLKPDVAQTLYGARAVHGVILITRSRNSSEIINNVEGAPTNSLRRNFRDDAYWQPALKTDASGKVRFSTTFPDDITNWRTFAIAIGGKKQTGYTEGLIRSFRPVSANLALPQFTVEGDSVNAIGKVLNYGTDSIRLTRSIRINHHLVAEGQLYVRNTSLDTISFVVPERDSVHVRMEIEKEDGYFDGEERGIPVYKRGTLETKGFFAALEGDTSLTVQLDPALGKVVLYAEASLLPVLLEETEHVFRYRYLCNEQLASKLKALLAQKRIYHLMGKDFKRDHAVTDIISRLQNNKTGNMWGWWINNEPAPWITLHVVEALLQAEKEGYKVTLPKTSIIDNLVFNMEQYRSSDKLLTLQLLKQLGAKADYKTYIDTLAKILRHGTLYDRLRLAELQQAEGLPFSIDSILAAPKRTLFGNLYWGEEGYRFFDNSIQNTLLVYRILRSKGGHEATLVKIRNYFLEKRKEGQWRNTYESSLILETILPDLVNNSGRARPAALRFTDEPDAVVSQFPFQKEVDAGSPIQISKSGDLPVYFTAYQQQWNKAPAAVAEAFQVNSFFERDKKRVTDLKAGEPVVLQVDIEAKGDADYVMIEIPIPAGCSYKDKPQPRFNNEVHREYFKDKVSIFCRSLKQGSYTFTVSLLPRYTGKYYLNPAKAEMMYFPLFYGKEGIKVISIE